MPDHFSSTFIVRLASAAPCWWAAKPRSLHSAASKFISLSMGPRPRLVEQLFPKQLFFQNTGFHHSPDTGKTPALSFVSFPRGSATWSRWKTTENSPPLGKLRMRTSRHRMLMRWWENRERNYRREREQQRQCLRDGICVFMCMGVCGKKINKFSLFSTNVTPFIYFPGFAAGPGYKVPPSRRFRWQ